MKRIFLMASLTITLALMLAACTATSNTNVNVRTNGMTNMGANNANIGAVAVNSNTNTVTTNSNRWSNSNVSRDQYDKNRGEYEKDRGTSTIGTGANDSWLWFKTRAALLATSDLRESTINVDVANDIITLKGTVATAAQKAKAADVANGIEGKKKVTNELKVAANDSMTNTSGSSNNANKR